MNPNYTKIIRRLTSVAYLCDEELEECIDDTARANLDEIWEGVTDLIVVVNRMARDERPEKRS